MGVVAVKRDNWPVNEYGIRPAGPQDKCIYCRAPKGEQHGAECVIRQRTVLVDVTVRMVLSVPEWWNIDLIESHDANGGGGCGDNAITHITEQAARIDDDGGCSCGLVRKAFVREATAGDEQRARLFVEGVPS